MRVRCGAHILKVGFCQRRLVSWQWMMACATGREEKNGYKRRQQDQRKVTSLSVGQGEPPARVINSYSQPGKNFLRQIWKPGNHESGGPRFCDPIHGFMISRLAFSA